PQRHADLVHKSAEDATLQSDMLEGENRNRGALKYGRQNERQPCGLLACALTSPQGRRRAFTEAAKVSGRKAPKVRKAAACSDVCDADLPPTRQQRLPCSIEAQFLQESARGLTEKTTEMLLQRARRNSAGRRQIVQTPWSLGLGL